MQIKKEYQNIKLTKGGYELNGKIYPRVSAMLNNLDKQGLVNWSAKQAAEFIDNKLLERFNSTKYRYEFDEEFKKQMIELAKTAHIRTRDTAGDTGNLIHKAIECWLKGEGFNGLAKSKEDFEIINKGLESFKSWWKKEGFELIASEMPVASMEYGYGGTVDILAKKGDEVILIDVKTKKGIYKDAKVQCGGYAIALDYMFESPHLYVNKAIICHIPKTNPKVKAIPIEGDKFESCKKAFINLVELHYNLEGIK